MAQVNVTTEAEPQLSIRQQLLLAQAVHQAQSSERNGKTVDWEQVTELLHGFQQGRTTEDWLLGTSFNPTVCSNVYSNICKIYLEKNLDQQESFGPSQTLTVARQLYEVHLRSIAEALLEEENKLQRLKTEIVAIEHGEWDDKLSLIAESEKPSSTEAPPVQSPKAPESPPVSLSKPSKAHPTSPSKPETSEKLDERDVDKESVTGGSLAAPVSLGRSAGKKSPILRTKRAVKKEAQDPSTSSEAPSEMNDSSLGNAEVTKSRKRKAPPASLSQRKSDKTPRQEAEKPSVTTPSDSSSTPEAPESPASDDDETVVQQLTRSRDRPTPSAPVTRKSRKVELGANEPAEPKTSDHKPSQRKKLKSDHEDPSDSKTPKILDKSLRSRTAIAKVPLTPNQEKTTVAQEKLTQDSEANLTSTKPSNHESPGANLSAKGPEETHSAAHSPSSHKKSLLENDHSAEGSRVGTPNSASFATAITDGNSTANLTPNSAKLPLFPSDVSSAGPRHGPSSSTSDPTSFRRRMLKTHSSVQSNPISSIFRDPVKESEAPGYTSIVKRPMDLRTLAKKLRDGKVTSTEEYRRDLMLMLANAVMFNHEDSEVTKHAKELMVECDRLVSIFMRGSRY